MHLTANGIPFVHERLQTWVVKMGSMGPINYGHFRFLSICSLTLPERYSSHFWGLINWNVFKKFAIAPITRFNIQQVPTYYGVWIGENKKVWKSFIVIRDILRLPNRDLILVYMRYRKLDQYVIFTISCSQNLKLHVIWKVNSRAI